MHGMDDAFTLLRQAVDLLPEDAVAENGQTVGDVREDIRRQEWEMVLGLLEEFGDVDTVSADFWELLAEAARQMMLDRSHRWCQWRGLGSPARRSPGDAESAGPEGGRTPNRLFRGRSAQAHVGHRQSHHRRETSTQHRKAMGGV
jgi:hypothetical protein